MNARTTCRVCESACGLLAEVEDGRVRALRPDPDHPLSRGYACVKGTRYAERVLHHPDRVLRPRLRDGDRWREASWDEALGAVGGRLRALLDAHGPDAVGLYLGNAAGHSLGAILGAAALQRALGTRKHYACLTLDNSEMFVVAEALFGDPLCTFVADYAGSDGVVLVGTDPLSSQASQAQSRPEAVRELLERGRAGALVVVDPRTSATAARASLHLRPRVGTDVFLLAWLLGEARPEPALAHATAPFTAERVARVTGIDPADLATLRDRLLGARRPLVWSGLGVLLGPHGTLGWWLTVALQATLGGLGVPGGWRLHAGAVDLGPWLRRLGVRGRDERVRGVGGWPAILGTLPAATLADDVLRDDPDRLRALVVIGGDPAAALPDTRRAEEALARLDLLVSVDLFARGTAARAHAVLPAATWLERAETGLHASNQRRVPFVRLDRPVVPPLGEARADWDVALGLCRAVGRPPFGSRLAGLAVRAGVGPVGVARLVLATSGVPWRAVASDEGWSSAAEKPVPPLRLAVPEWCAALRALPDPDPGLRLLTSVRPIGAMNHWLRPDGAPVAYAHPDDVPPGPVVLEGPGGTLAVTVEADAGLPRGTVVVPFGDARTNPNHLVGTAALEPFTGQPVSNGTVVRATRA